MRKIARTGSFPKSRKSSLQELRRMPVDALRIAFAFVFEKLKIRLRVACEVDADVPLAFENFRILDGRLVTQGVGSSPRLAFDNMELAAVKITRVVEPCLRLKVGHVHHERVPFPASHRVPHVELDAFVVVRTSIREDHAIGVNMLIDDHDTIRILKDLEWFR